MITSTPKIVVQDSNESVEPKDDQSKDVTVPAFTVTLCDSGVYDNSESIIDDEFADDANGTVPDEAMCDAVESSINSDFAKLYGEPTESDAPPKLSNHHDDSVFSPNLLSLYTDDSGNVTIHPILAQLKKNGIRPFADPRLSAMMEKLSIDPDGLTIASEIGVKKLVPIDEFLEASKNSNELLNQCLSSNMIVPDFQAFCVELKKLHNELKSFNGGKNADYIPQLSRVNPKFWGISICTVDGQRFSVGDTDIPFCIQSCSKALNYAINVTEHGHEFVHNYLGKEPSGSGFNQIALDKNGVPHNPMINPGAISCCSVIKCGESLADKFDYIIENYKKIAGNEFIGFSNATFLSEKSVADRNFAIAYFLKEHNVFPPGTNLKDILDLYFQLCSVESTSDSAAVICATLANGGVCPTTKEECVTADAVRNTLSLMYSCGMYDYSGEWAFEVGLPAKSGVAGSIFIVIPEVMGICVWSPPLDDLGNSYRGIEFAKRLVKRFAFHQFDIIQGNQLKIDPRRHQKSESKEIQILNMISAANNNDMVLLTKYFEIGIDFNLADYDNRTPLHLAVAAGNLAVVKFLVDKAKVNINPLDRMNCTPLDEALMCENMPDVIAYLKSRKAKVGQELVMEACMQY